MAAMSTMACLVQISSLVGLGFGAEKVAQVCRDFLAPFRGRVCWWGFVDDIPKDGIERHHDADLAWGRGDLHERRPGGDLAILEPLAIKAAIAGRIEVAEPVPHMRQRR